MGASASVLRGVSRQAGGTVYVHGDRVSQETRQTGGAGEPNTGNVAFPAVVGVSSEQEGAALEGSRLGRETERLAPCPWVARAPRRAAERALVSSFPPGWKSQRDVHGSEAFRNFCRCEQMFNESMSPRTGGESRVPPGAKEEAEESWRAGSGSRRQSCVPGQTENPPLPHVCAASVERALSRRCRAGGGGGARCARCRALLLPHRGEAREEWRASSLG